MKLWLLVRKPEARERVYDVVDGFVVCARSKQKARALAATHARDEGSETWTDSERSSCECIGSAIAEHEGVVLRDANPG